MFFFPPVFLNNMYHLILLGNITLARFQNRCKKPKTSYVYWKYSEVDSSLYGFNWEIRLLVINSFEHI